MNNTNKNIKIVINGITALLFLLSCFFMYDFYKCLSGFIANGFREPFVMLPLILNYFAPVLAFLFFFYDFYVNGINKWVKLAYSIVIIALCLFNSVGIISNFSLYASNNALGVYESLPSIILAFPYDGIIINALLLAFQIFNVYSLVFPKNKLAINKEKIKQNGTFSIGKVEYLLLCIIAILCFVFIASALCAVFNALENAKHDGKFIYLVLWVLLIPLVDILMLVYKIENREYTKSVKITALATCIAFNVVFGVLLAVFESLSPDFMVLVGKPLFMIAFSVSLPIEQLAMILIMAVSTIVFLVRLLKLVIKK